MVKSRLSRRAPVIGIDCSTGRPETQPLIPKTAMLNVMPYDYVESVEMAGGLPLLLPLTRKREHIVQMLDKIDGLILSGGHDIDPSYYGQSPHLKLGRQDVEKDRYESVLIPLAMRKKSLPMLGICRGIQSLNVFCGGTLLQDLSLVEGSPIKHRQETDLDSLTHQFLIEPGTRLHQIFGKRRMRSNSYHHQVVDQVAPGWVVSARSEDGLIEAIEKPGKRFLVGVQPHPERLVWDFPEHRKIFQALIRATANR